MAELGFVIFHCIMLHPKAVSINGAVSPITLDMDNNIPVMMPSYAEGNMILIIVEEYDAPRDNPDSFKLIGNILSVSSVERTINGNIIIASDMLPANAEYPFNGITIAMYVIIPMIIDGILCNISAKKRTVFANHLFLFSEMYIPHAIPVGIAITDAIITINNVPMIPFAIPPGILSPEFFAINASIVSGDVLIKKSMFICGKPFIINSPNMENNGITEIHDNIHTNQNNILSATILCLMFSYFVGDCETVILFSFFNLISIA